MRAVPWARAACAIDSTVASRNASITDRPTSVPGARPSSVWAAAFAEMTRRLRSTRTIPEPNAPSRPACSAAACGDLVVTLRRVGPKAPVRGQRSGQGARIADGDRRDDDRDDGQPQADDDPRVHGSSIAQPAARRSGKRATGQSPPLRRPTRAPQGARRGMRSPSHGAACRSNSRAGNAWRRTSRCAIRAAARRAGAPWRSPTPLDRIDRGGRVGRRELARDAQRVVLLGRCRTRPGRRAEAFPRAGRRERTDLLRA